MLAREPVSRLLGSMVEVEVEVGLTLETVGVVEEVVVIGLPS